MIVMIEKFTLADFRPFSKMKATKEIIFTKQKRKDDAYIDKEDQAEWEPLKKIVKDKTIKLDFNFD